MTNYIKNILFTFSRQFFSLIISMFTSIIIARYLGIEDRGVYALILLLPTTLYTLLNFGINSSVIYYIGQKMHSIKDMIQSLKLLTILTIFISSLIGILIIVFYQEIFFKDVDKNYLFIALVFLPSFIYNSFFQAIFIGHEDFKTFNYILLIQPIIFLFFIIINLLLDYKLEGILAAELVANYITSILTYVYIVKKYGSQTGKISFSLISLKVNYGLKIHLTNMMSFINYRLDLFMVSYFLDIRAVGAYVIAINIAEKLWIVSRTVASVMFARISNEKNNNEKYITTIYSAKIVSLISILTGIIFYFFGEEIILLLFGDEYKSSILPFLYLLFGVILGSVARIFSSYIAGEGKPEYNLYVSLVLICINIILNIILIQKYGLIGAALATSISETINYIFKIYIFKWMSNVPLFQILFPSKNEMTKLKLIYKMKK